MNQESLKDIIMKGIHDGKVQMRPRWHFMLLSALMLVGALVVCLTLIYAVSLVVYLLHSSGAWFAPSFGLRGWFAFLYSLPWLLLLLLLVFVVILEILVRRYTFVYKKPLLTSVLGIVAVIVAGGFLVTLTPLHKSMAHFDHDGMLPPPLNGLYRQPPHFQTSDLYRGMIVAIAPDHIVVSNGESTTTVFIDTHTRLPYGNEFTAGNLVIVIGDFVSTDTIRAFGIRSVEPEGEDDLSGHGR
ncbi:MAG: hypothetical protein JWM46_237 [Candidatus Kaiserbacteria bacterium]|nr:hypothetical protein [Candidatus Kaiserbacteria bacterium]